MTVICYIIVLVYTVYLHQSNKVLRKQKQKLRASITHILECKYLTNGAGGACVKSLENLLEDTVKY